MTQKIISQFWIGNFDSEDRFYKFFCEDENFFSEENQDRDDYPLSEFIASQKETWYDHNFFEHGFNDDEQRGIEKRFAGHSWVEKWAPIVEQKLQELGISTFNAFAMMGVDQQPGFGLRSQISNPCSFSGEGVELTYLGEITHEP